MKQRHIFNPVQEFDDGGASSAEKSTKVTNMSISQYLLHYYIFYFLL